MIDNEALKRLGVDTEAGIAYCAGDPEFYEEMLREYLDESAARLANLKRFFEERDWKQYGISAHSLKNTSKMIGASVMSEAARQMETAAKEGDEGSLLSGHESFISELSELNEALGAALGRE